MNTMSIIIVIAVGIIVLTRGQIFDTLGAAIGLGEKVAGKAKQAIEGIGMIIDVTEDAIEGTATWAAEQWYFNESLSSSVIEGFEEQGITGANMRYMIESIESGNFQMFRNIITRETCSEFWQTIVNETAGYTRWAKLNEWAIAQVQAILQPQ